MKCNNFICPNHLKGKFRNGCSAYYYDGMKACETRKRYNRIYGKDISCVPSQTDIGSCNHDKFRIERNKYHGGK